MGDSVRAFAPATVANLGPGFDVLGLALREPGDHVTARRTDGDGVTLTSITGDHDKLPRDAAANTAGIAAIAVLKRAGIAAGIELELDKGLPLASGLGSSAASACAAATAVNVLLGSPLEPIDLVEACIEAEEVVAGRHADNVAPSILGGLVLIRSVDPLDVVRLPVPEGLTVVVTTPAMEISTRAARAVLPRAVTLGDMVANQAAVAGLVSACHSGDLDLLSRCLEDRVVTPARAALIPGWDDVTTSASLAGALGSGVSGSGPSVFALCEGTAVAKTVAEAMAVAFKDNGLSSTSVISPANCPGARVL